MVASKVARRYAKSLMLLSVERNEMDAAFNDLLYIKNVLQENRDLRVMLNSPVIKTYKKQNVLNAIFGGQLGDLVNGFVRIITSNNRESLLEEIAVGFVDLYNEYKKVVTAKVTTAVPMDDELKNKVKSIVANLENNSIEIIEEVDPEIIGGVILRVGDVQVDASVSRQLQELKKELQETNFKNKLG